MKATPEPKVCSVEGCVKVARSRRLMCEMHYFRMRKHGSLDLPPREFVKDKPCAADGCETQAKTKGYCGKHWERVRLHGDASHVKVILDDPIKRFLTFVTKTPTCWLWTGSLTYDGYAIFGVKGRRTGAHRWSYRFFVGPIPRGLQIDHLCRVRNCVNPDHLEAVTPLENWRRSESPTLLHSLKPRCPLGHEYSSDGKGGRYCKECGNERRRQRKAASR